MGDEEEEASLGAVRYPVMPSLMALQQMRNRLHLAKLGKKLMKWTALATGKELRRLSMEMTTDMKDYGVKVRNAFMLLARARYFASGLNATVLESVPKQACVTVTATSRSVSGVKLKNLQLVEMGCDSYKYLGMSKGGAVIKECKEAWLDLLRTMVLLCQFRFTFVQIDLAHKNATKKQNVLARCVIPRIIITIRYILSELDEQEREESFRLKRFKQLKYKNVKPKSTDTEKSEEEPVCYLLEEEEPELTKPSPPKAKPMDQPEPEKIIPPVDLCSCATKVPPSPKVEPIISATPKVEPIIPPTPKVDPCSCATKMQPPKEEKASTTATQGRLDRLMTQLNEILQIAKELEAAKQTSRIESFIKCCDKVKGKIKDLSSAPSPRGGPKVCSATPSVVSREPSISIKKLTIIKSLVSISKPSGKPSICSKPSEKPSICSNSSEKLSICSKPSEKLSICSKASEKPSICSKPSEKPSICSKPSEKPSICSKLSEKKPSAVSTQLVTPSAQSEVQSDVFELEKVNRTTLGEFEKRFEEEIKVTRTRNPDGSISEEKQIITIQTETRTPRPEKDGGGAKSPCGSGGQYSSGKRGDGSVGSKKRGGTQTHSRTSKFSESRTPSCTSKTSESRSPTSICTCNVSHVTNGSFSSGMSPIEIFNPCGTPKQSEISIDCKICGGSTPSETAKPSGTPKPSDTSKPYLTLKPSDTSKTYGTPKPSETSKPCGASKKSETSTPCMTPKPTETFKPCGASKPTDPCGAQKPSETSKPCGIPKPNDTSEPCKICGSSTPSETFKPCGCAKSSKIFKTCGTPTPSETAKPCGFAKSSETSKLREVPKLNETSKPCGALKPSETSKPCGASKHSLTSKPCETPKPSETLMPCGAAKASESFKPCGCPAPSVITKPSGTPKPSVTLKPCGCHETVLSTASTSRQSSDTCTCISSYFSITGSYMTGHFSVGVPRNEQSSCVGSPKRLMMNTCSSKSTTSSLLASTTCSCTTVFVSDNPSKELLAPMKTKLTFKSESTSAHSFVQNLPENPLKKPEQKPAEKYSGDKSTYCTPNCGPIRIGENASAQSKRLVAIASPSPSTTSNSLKRAKAGQSDCTRTSLSTIEPSIDSVIVGRGSRLNAVRKMILPSVNSMDCHISGIASDSNLSSQVCLCASSQTSASSTASSAIKVWQASFQRNPEYLASLVTKESEVEADISYTQGVRSCGSQSVPFKITPEPTSCAVLAECKAAVAALAEHIRNAGSFSPSSSNICYPTFGTLKRFKDGTTSPTPQDKNNSNPFEALYNQEDRERIRQWPYSSIVDTHLVNEKDQCDLVHKVSSSSI